MLAVCMTATLAFSGVVPGAFAQEDVVPAATPAAQPAEAASAAPTATPEPTAEPVPAETANPMATDAANQAKNAGQTPDANEPQVLAQENETLVSVQANAANLSELINADLALLNWKTNGGTVEVALNGQTYTVTDDSSYQTAYAAVYAALQGEATLINSDVAAVTINTDTVWNVTGSVKMNGSITVASGARFVILGDGEIAKTGTYGITNWGTLAMQGKVFLNGSGLSTTLVTAYGETYLTDRFRVGNNDDVGINVSSQANFYMSGGLVGTKEITFHWRDENDNDIGSFDYDTTLQRINTRIENEDSSVYEYIASIETAKGCANAGVYVSAGSIYMTDGTIAGNGTTSTDTAGVFIGGEGKACITGGLIFGNQSNSGGGIADFGHEAQLMGGNVIGNHALGYGGGIRVGTDMVVGGEAIIAYNSSTANGGAFVVNGGCKVAIKDDVLVTHNTAIGTIDLQSDQTGSGNGGAFRVVGTLEVAGGRVTWNYANGRAAYSPNYRNSGHGGVISAQTDSQARIAKIILTGGIFENNKARENGGAINASCMASDLEVTFALQGTQIRNNQAGGNGGGVYLAAREGRLNANIESGTLSGNEAGASGGGMYLELGHVDTGTTTIYGQRLTVNIGTGDAQALNVFGNTAVKNGGAFYVGRSEKNTFVSNTLEVNFKNGALTNNKATNGGGISVVQGNLNISGGTAANNEAELGGGVYLANGDLTVGGGSFSSNTAKNGGGAYLSGGTLTINGGAFNGNTASENGGCAYAADGAVRMFGGFVTGNHADKDGGGLYVSSAQKAADIVVRSGSITNNTSGGSGGGIAVAGSTANTADKVVLGLLEPHPGLDAKSSSRAFTAFDYKDTVDSLSHNHASCPVLTGNTATGNGGGIYMSSPAAKLDIYCLTESGNTSQADANGSSIMTVGGTVTIGDEENNNQDARGNIEIASPMLVQGGEVDIWGNMHNPKFDENILVDIQANAGKFEDHRGLDNFKEKSFKVHYFENFTNGGEHDATGLYIAKQYENSEDVPALGTLFTHEGWKIVGWDTQGNGKGTRYNIGDMIGSENDHTAWPRLPEDPLILYAIWERTGYTVVFNPNAPAGTAYSGSMANQKFEYGVEKTLTPNAFKIAGKRFTGWNTSADGTGTAYPADYKASTMINEDGATVTLYAQWVDCTHKGGAYPGKITYTASSAAITAACDCGGYTATVALSAVNHYFDNAPHPAQMSTTGTLLENAPAIQYQYRADENSQYGQMPDGETVPTSVGQYRASITLGGATAFVEYKILSPTEGINLDAKAAAGQYFADFNGSNAVTISQDDAFTVQFDVLQLNTEVYQTEPKLTFSAALPAGTTIILQTGGTYWYLNVAAPGSREIELTDFTQMGGTGKYQYTEAKTQSYRFIVDFSQASEQPQTRTVSLTYAPTGAAGELTKAVALTTAAKTEFALTAAGNVLTVQAPAAAPTNRWNGKQLTLVLTAPEGIPADAALTVTTGQGNTVYHLNARRQFVVPLAWATSQTATLQLNSELAAQAGKMYKLTAKLYTGVQGATLATTGKTADVGLTIPASAQPSLKLSGGTRIVSKAVNELTLTVKMQNVEGCTISATIQKKNGSDYSGNFLSMGTLKAGEQTLSLAAITDPGSYRVLATVAKDGRTLLTVPYYFIVK